MIKTILLTAIAAMTISCGNAQENLKMEEKKIKIRNNQVEINYLSNEYTTLAIVNGEAMEFLRNDKIAFASALIEKYREKPAKALNKNNDG